MADSVKIKITGDDSGFKKTLSGIGGSATSMCRNLMASASQIVTNGISLITSGIKSALDVGMQFEAAMSQVAAISGATEEELARLTETAKHYGATTKFTASQAAEALNYMALAGWDTQQSIDALGGVLSLAASSGMQLGAAADAVTDYIAAFGMEASQAGYMADLMSYAQARSNTTASMLADAYGNCASSMHAAGQDIETTTAMLMALANQGIKGSEAGTQMAAVMRDLTQKMKDGQITIGKTKVQVSDAAGNFRDLNDIMADVAKATEGMGSAEKSAAIMQTFTARSVKAINTILNEGIDSVNGYEAALRESAGTAAEQSEKMLDNLSGDIDIFNSALEGLKITASESFNGIARELVQEGTSILDAINRGGRLNGISGMADEMISLIPTLIPKLVSKVEQLINGISAKLPALVKKIGALLPGILDKGLKLIPTLTKTFTSALSSAAESIASNLPEIITSIFTELPNILGSIFEGAMNVVGGLMNGLSRAMAKMGLREWTLSETLQNAVDAVDPELITKIRAAADVEYTVEKITVNAEDVRKKVDEAVQTIREILLGEGIDEETAAGITNAIQSGSGYDTLVAALDTLGLPEGKAEEIAADLRGALDTITGVMNGLDLSDTAKHAVMQSLFARTSAKNIRNALIAFGVNPKDAEEAAGSLSDSVSAIGDVITGLNLEPWQEKAVTEAAYGGASKEAIHGMLYSWGVDDETAAPAAAKITEGVTAFRDALLGIGLEEAQANAMAQMVYGDTASAFIADMLTGFGLTEEEATEKAGVIQSATDDFRTTLENLNLDKANENAVTQAALGGESAESISAMLQGFGKTKDEADAASTKITDAMGVIDKTLQGVGLDDTTRGAIAAALLESNQTSQDIEDMLIGYGVDPETAKEAAKSLTGAKDEVNTALGGLDLDTGKAMAFLMEAGVDKTLIRTALQMLGLNDVDIESITGSYSTIQESIGGGFSALASNLIASLTNGIPDDADAQFKKAREDIVAFLGNAQSVVDTWEENMISGLKDGSIKPEDGKTVEQAIADVQTQATEMQSTIGSVKSNVETWMAEMANQPKEYVEAHIQELYALLDEVYAVDAAMASLNAGISSVGAADRAAVEAGALTDAESQMSAIAFSEKELQNALDQSKKQTELALAEAATKYGNDVDTYALEKDKILHEEENREKKAYDEYNKHMSDILRSMVTSNADLSTSVNEYKGIEDDINQIEGFLTLLKTWNDNIDDLVSLPEALQEVSDDEAAYNALVSSYAERFGLSVDALNTAIQNGIEDSEDLNALFSEAMAQQGIDEDYITGFFGGPINDFFTVDEIELNRKIDELKQRVAEIIKNGDMNEVLAVIDQAIEMELLKAPEGYDFSSVADVYDYIVREVFSEPIKIDAPDVEMEESPAETVIREMEDGEEATATVPVNVDVDTAQAEQGAAQAAEAVETAMSGLPDDTEDIGTQSGRGLGNGLAEQKSYIVSTARDIALSVRQEFERVLDVHSPSRVMQRIGAFTGEGFEIGLRDSISNAVRAAQSVVSVANLKPRMDFSGVTGALSGTVQSIADIENDRPINLYANGKLMASTLRRDNAAAASQYDRSISLGVGRQ